MVVRRLAIRVRHDGAGSRGAAAGVETGGAEPGEVAAAGAEARGTEAGEVAAAGVEAAGAEADGDVAVGAEGGGAAAAGARDGRLLAPPLLGVMAGDREHVVLRLERKRPLIGDPTGDRRLARVIGRRRQAQIAEAALKFT